MWTLKISIRLNEKVVCYWAVDDNIHIEVHAWNFHKINTPVHHNPFLSRHWLTPIDSIIEMSEQDFDSIVLDIPGHFVRDTSMNKVVVTDWHVNRHLFDSYNKINMIYIDLISIEINYEWKFHVLSFRVKRKKKRKGLTQFDYLIYIDHRWINEWKVWKIYNDKTFVLQAESSGSRRKKKDNLHFHQLIFESTMRKFPP